MNKKIIWDLFGGGQNSVYETLKEYDLLDKYIVYTFDITTPTREHHYKLDLTQPDIVNTFKSFARPDIIVASPLCGSFSSVLSMKGGGTPFWKYNDAKTKLIQRTMEEFETLKSGFTKKLKGPEQLFRKILGQKCIDATLELIKAYQPEYWYIENPRTSLMWKYITLNREDFYEPETMYLNRCSYGKYGFLTNKPTIFMSNVKMELLEGKTPPPYTTEYIDGVKWYVMKDDRTIRSRWDMNTMLHSPKKIKKLLKARQCNSGMGEMDFVMKNENKRTTKEKTHIISEAGGRSAIPHSLIIDIFKQFKKEEENE